MKNGGFVMKNVTKLIAIIFVFCIITCTFAACNENDETTVALAIAVQNTKGNTIHKFSDDSAFYNRINEACLIEGSVVQSYEYDGKAYPLKCENVKFDSGLTNSNKKSEAEENAKKILRSLNEAVPQTAEVDFLYLLKQISAFLASYDVEKREAVIIGNLLSTSGLINFANDTLYVDENDYINYLSGEIPNLNRINISYYVSEASDAQAALKESDISHLKSIYTKLVESVGGTISFYGISDTGVVVDKSEWRDVSTVDVRTTSYSGGVAPIDVTLNETYLGFVSDSTEFLDEAKAKNVLMEYVSKINSSNGVIIAASTAATDSSPQSHISFSKKRAERTKALLIYLGANPEKLTVVGLGKERHPWRVDDETKFASEESHKANRVVYIVDKNSDKAIVFQGIEARLD